ncbi:MAG: hypothetical protein Q8L64_01900 [bacterium]|nr:hypothetical protein [bacterium]
MIRKENFLPMLNTLDSIQKKYHKRYCYPSQAHTIALLKTFHDTCFSTRTLNRYYRVMEDQGFIKRRRRIRRLENGLLQFQTTLYVLTRKAYKLIGSLVRKLSHHTKNIFSQLTQKESPSTPSWMLGPDEKPSPFADLVPGLARNLLKTMT